MTRDICGPSGKGFGPLHISSPAQPFMHVLRPFVALTVLSMMNIDNDLCGPCHQFFAGWPAFCKTQNNISEANSRYKAPYHPTIRSWRAAAEHGCCLCTLSLWQFKSKIKREEGQYHVVDIEGVADLKIEVSGWFNDNVWKAISWSIKADTIILGEFHDPSLNWGLNFHAAEMSGQSLNSEASGIVDS